MKTTIPNAALATLALIGAVATTTPALAQSAPPPAGEAHGPRRDGHKGDMRAQMEAMRQAHEQQRAQDLRTILRLRADQEPALTAFLASQKRPEGMRDAPWAGPEGRRGPPAGPAGGPSAARPGPSAMTTPQRLDMEARREAEMSARRQKHMEALKAFYGALSPDQRQVFDALQRVQGHGGDHRGGGHHGFGGPGFGGPPCGFGRGDE